MRIIYLFVVILLLIFVPVLSKGVVLSDIERLGKIMYQDKDFSRNGTQSCMTCHHHISGFADPQNMRDPYYSVVSLGDDGTSLGGRNAPTSAYGGYSPPLEKQADGNYAGGLFWDGRATGLTSTLQDPLAEQAQGPPLNPVEMNMESEEAVVDVVRNSSYRNLFLRVFGADSLNDTAEAYDNIARAIAAYERSVEVQSFSSRFDAGELNALEQEGFALVEAHCTTCHRVDSQYLLTIPPAPLFTSYGYVNIGVPRNPLLESNPVDFGLGATVDDPLENGKFKIPTLRNVALTAPYSHNGYFPTLRDMVLFKSTRDLLPWEEPEVSENLSMELGNFNFTSEEIDAIIAFLQSLTDR